jgi:membrane-associated phospholipid phosphatase
MVDRTRGDTTFLAPVGVVPFVAVALLLLAVTLASMAVPDLNTRWFVATQAWTRALPDPFWSMVTICGTGVVAFAWLSVTLPWRPRCYAAAVPAAALAGLYSNGLKHLYGLPRPPSVLDAAHLHVIGHALHANTFPSGHTVTAFTLASLLMFASRSPLRTALWTVPLAVLVAVSRIAVGAHWPADLAAGALGGWLSGSIGVVLAARWRGWNTPAGVRLLGVIAIGIGGSLFIVDLGYPQALALQRLMGVVAIAGGLWTVARPRIDTSLPDRWA